MYKKIISAFVLLSIFSGTTFYLTNASDNHYHFNNISMSSEEVEESENEEDLDSSDIDDIDWSLSRKVNLSNGKILSELFYMDTYLTAINLDNSTSFEEDYIIDYNSHYIEYRLYSSPIDYIKFIILESNSAVILRTCKNGEKSDYIRFDYEINDDYIRLINPDSLEFIKYFSKDGKLNVIESTTNTNFDIPENILRRIYFLTKTDINDVQEDIFMNFVSPVEEELEYIPKDSDSSTDSSKTNM